MSRTNCTVFSRNKLHLLLRRKRSAFFLFSSSSQFRFFRLGTMSRSSAMAFFSFLISFSYSCRASNQGGMCRAQLGSKDPVYPVSGIVLDWTRKSARITASLHELLNEEGASREDIDRVDDVKLNIFHMRHLPKEVRDRFVSDMGFVVDYLNEGILEGRKAQKILHVEALCEMMAALTGDARFTERIEELLKRQRKGGEIIMCDYIDMLEASGEAHDMIKGEELGMAKGEKIGIAKGENRLSVLLTARYSLRRDEEVKLAVSDIDARTRLYREFSIA